MYFVFRLMSSVRLTKIVAEVKMRFQNKSTETKTQMNWSSDVIHSIFMYFVSIFLRLNSCKYSVFLFPINFKCTFSIFNGSYFPPSLLLLGKAQRSSVTITAEAICILLQLCRTQGNLDVVKITETSFSGAKIWILYLKVLQTDMHCTAQCVLWKYGVTVSFLA